MKRRAYPTLPGARRRALWSLPLVLLLASEARAALQDINLDDPCPNPIYTIETVANSPFMVNIGLNPTAGNFFWAFSTAPPTPPCSGVAPSFNCNGIIVTAPTGSVPGTATVTVSGTPSAAATSFNFTLQVSEDGGTGKNCSREYHVVVNKPFDIVFVLDRSGSMGADADPGNPGTSRWDALRTSVLDAGMMTGLVTKLPGAPAASTSKFGLTLFSTGVIPTSLSGLVSIDGNLISQVSAAVPNSAPDPSGMTAMGKGLKDGEAKMMDCNRPRVVVLFTDGEQNQPPQVLPSGAGYDDATPVNAKCPGGPQKVEVVSVGILQPGSSYLATLQALATANGNNPTIITTTGVSTNLGSIEAAFDAAIAPALKGNSPQIVATYQGDLAGVVTLPAFDLNQGVSQLLIKLSFSHKLETQQLAQILGGVRVLRDGTDVTHFFRPVTVGGFTNSALLQGVFSVATTAGTLTPEGSYTLEMTVPAGIGPGLRYRVVPFADDHRLDMDWQVSPAEPRVNQPFRPTMKLSWLSRPVTGATVEALILKPGDDLGDLLAKDPRKADLSRALDAGSPGYQKYLELLKDPAFLAKLLPAEQHLTLAHQGNGVYTAAYNPGDVSGVYQVLYEVRDDDPAFGKVQRQTAQSVYVRFGTIDLAASAVSTTVVDRVVMINFRPKTITGRFVGPANASAISVTGSGASINRIDDHQDGSYTVVLNGDPNAEVSVAVLGEEIYRGPAEGFGTIDKCKKWPRCLRWLCRLFKGK